MDFKNASIRRRSLPVMRTGEFAAVIYKTCHRLGPHAVVTIPLDDDDVYIWTSPFVPWTDFFPSSQPPPHYHLTPLFARRIEATQCGQKRMVRFQPRIRPASTEDGLGDCHACGTGAHRLLSTFTSLKQGQVVSVTPHHEILRG